MTDIKNIKEILAKVTKGEDWTNFDGKADSLFVYEYDSLTEDTCDIIAECKTVETANFLSTIPELFRSLITTIESQKEEIEQLKNRLNLVIYQKPQSEIQKEISK